MFCFGNTKKNIFMSIRNNSAAPTPLHTVPNVLPDSSHTPFHSLGQYLSFSLSLHLSLLPHVCLSVLSHPRVHTFAETALQAVAECESSLQEEVQEQPWGEGLSEALKGSPTHLHTERKTEGERERGREREIKGQSFIRLKVHHAWTKGIVWRVGALCRPTHVGA